MLEHLHGRDHLEDPIRVTRLLQRSEKAAYTSLARALNCQTVNINAVTLHTGGNERLQELPISASYIQDALTWDNRKPAWQRGVRGFFDPLSTTRISSFL